MSKEDKTMLVPKLRFPEFQGALSWNKHFLEEYLTESRIKGSRGDVAKKITVKLWGKGVYKKNDKIKGSANTQYYRRSAGQFIYSKLDFLNQGFGLIPNNLDNYESTVDLPCFDINKGINPIFLLEYVQRKDFYERLGEIADGSRKAKRIHADTFLTFPIFIPNIEEQQKIADCLSSIDELITAHTQKHEALKAHKKGLMQQLFPAEGEAVPKLRFPEFQDRGEWEKAKLGDPEFSKFIKDRIPLDQLEIETYISTENLLPDYAGIKTASKLPPSGSFTQFKKNDILISNIRPYLKKVWQAQVNGSASNDVIVIRAKSKITDNFLMHLLKNDVFIHYVMKDAKGVKMPRGDISSIKKYSLSYPSRNEQQKIANCLSSIDTLITTQAQKIESLKAHKKGLMQQLFPATDGANG